MNSRTNKNMLRIMTILMSVVLLLTLLSACGSSGLSGAYDSEWIGTLDFKGENKVVYTEADYGLGEAPVIYEGTYEIVEDKIIFDFGNEDAAPQGENAFEQGDGWIKIDGFTFVKK